MNNKSQIKSVFAIIISIVLVLTFLILIEKNSDTSILNLDILSESFKESKFFLEHIGDLTIVSQGKEWNVIKSTGQESDLVLWIANAKDKKTEIGWIPKDNDCTGLEDKYLYNENNEKILDDKDKDIKLKCKSSKCEGQNCYHISLTDAQAVNIDEYIKLGEASAIIVYQDINTLNYHLDWANVNVTLFKNISESWNNTVNDIWVFNYPNSKKFGANDSENNDLEKYKYKIKSTRPIIQNKWNPYITNPVKQKKSGFFGYTYTETHEFNFNDICSRGFEPYNVSDDFENYTAYNKTADCEFDYYDIWNRNETIIICDGEIDCSQNHTEEYEVFDYYLEVEFLSDKDIDPTITIGEDETAPDSLLTNVTAETGVTNFTHLNISTTAPYDSLVGYWNFDGDLEETLTTTHYDFTSQGNDGAGVGHANASSTNCMENFGNCAQFDGDGDYIDIGQDVGAFTDEIFTISTWVYPRGFASTQWGIIEGGANYAAFVVRTDGKLRLAKDGVAWMGESANAIGLNSWSHVAVTYNTTHVKYYINGTLDDTDASSQTFTSSNTLIGSYNGVECNGTLDEIMIFDAELTPAQIQDIYNNQSARYLPSGTQRVRAVNVTNSSEWENNGYNRVNLTTTYQTNLFSNISARVGQINFSVDPDGLVLYMPFEWGSAVDVSGNGNDGTIVNDVLFNETGGVNETGGFEFDGDGDSISLGIHQSLNLTSKTLTMWFKQLDAGPYNALFYTETNNYINIWGDSIYLRMWKNGSGSNIAFDDYNTPIDNLDQWYHVAFTYNITGNDVNVTMYVDGNYENSQANSQGFTPEPISRIGAKPNGANSMNGTIDEVMIFNRSLSAEEIEAIFNNQSIKYNIPYYTDYQNLSGTYNVFNISNEADYIFPDFTFISDSNNFYSPILQSSLELEVWDFSGIPPPPSDTTPPTISIIYPINNTNFSNTGLHVNYTAEDETALDECWYQNDSMTINVTLTDCGTNITSVTWAEGWHNVTIFVNDSSDNVNNETISFRIDTTNPNINITYPINNTNFSYKQVDINFTYSDIVTGSCWYSNDSEINNYTITGCSNLTSKVWLEGINNITIFTNDSVGNENSSSVWFMVDTTPPTITLTSPGQGTQDTDGILKFTFNPTDINTINNCSLFYQGGIYTTSTSITKDVNNIIEIIGIDYQHPLYKDDLQWGINCTDDSNNVGNSETRNLDTKEDFGSAGSGTGTQVSKRNPKFVELFYPETWYRNSEEEIIIKTFNYDNLIFNPKNITMNFTILGVSLKESKVDKLNQTINIFKINKDAELGEHSIIIEAEDEKIITREIKIKIEKEQTYKERIISQRDNEIRILFWAICGIIILTVLTLLMVAVFKDKTKTEQKFKNTIFK